MGELYIEKQIRAKRLPRGSFAIFLDTVINGEVERSKFGQSQAVRSGAPGI
jgi:hypothetical protein